MELANEPEEPGGLEAAIESAPLIGANGGNATYARCIEFFALWLDGFGIGDVVPAGHQPAVTAPRPPRVVLRYLTELASEKRTDGTFRYSSSALNVTHASINWDHARHGFVPPGADPSIEQAMRHFRRMREATAPVEPINLHVVRKMLSCLDPLGEGTVGARRDRGLLLLAYSASLAHQELAALQVGDLRFEGEAGVLVSVGHGLTESRRRSRTVRILPGARPGSCTACALVAWLACWPLSYGSVKGAPRSPARLSGSGAHLCVGEQSSSAPLGAFLFPQMTGSRTLIESPLTPGALERVLVRVGRAAGIKAKGLTCTAWRLGFVLEAIKGGAAFSDISLHCGYATSKPVKELADRFGLVERHTTVSIGL